MVYLLKYIYSTLSDLYYSYKDPRVEHLPLVGPPFPIFLILAAYLAFVLEYGPKWMEKRGPYDLKYVIRIYNAVQVVANLVIFVYGLPVTVFHKDFSLTCQPVDTSNREPWMTRLLYATYGYYLTKYLDLLDTVFFILRKKNNQITFLHVYHHAGMVFAVYAFMTFLPGSHSTMLGVINLFVHTIMYGYYFVTSLRPIKRTLWWKRHITQLQLLQFGYLMLHFLQVVVRNDCQHPLLIAMIGLTQNFFMFVMFSEFYYKNYIKKPKLAKAAVERLDKKATYSPKITTIPTTLYPSSPLGAIDVPVKASITNVEVPSKYRALCEIQ